MPPNAQGELSDAEVFGGGGSAPVPHELSDEEVFGSAPMPKPPFGPIRPGNINLNSRPVVKNPDGSVSTVRSIGVGTNQGEVNIPTVAPDGRPLQSFILKNPYQPAIDRFKQTGENLGTYGTPMAADAFAEQLHNQQADLYAPPEPKRPSLWERATYNAEDAWKHGTLAGATYDYATGGKKQPEISSFMDAPTFGQRVLEGGAALGGQVAGSIPSPESFVGLPEKGALAVGEAIARVLPRLFGSTVAKKVAVRGGEQAIINTATDPVVQETNIAAGSRDSYDPVQTAMSPALGFLVGGSVEGAKGLANIFRTWRGRQGAKVAPDAAPTPDEVAGFEGSPELKTFLAANGITDPKDPRVIQLEDRLAARRTAEGQRGAPQQQGGPSGKFNADQQRLVNERQAVEAGVVDPAATSTAGRIPPQEPGIRQPQVDLAEMARTGESRVTQSEPIIPVDSQGRADTGDPAMRAATELRGKNNALVPLERPVERMTPEEIAQSRAKMEGGNPNTAPDVGTLRGSENRSPQSIDQNIGQQQSGDAFKLAELQRQRAGADVRDTQPAGRPEGADKMNVVLDEGFPVQILERTHKTVGSRTVEMARVHRYDPRTGALDPEALPYDVPVNQLKNARYAQQPRMAQDFEARAAGPTTPEQPRMADEAVRREPNQTYRTTPPDQNADFPGASSAEGRVPPEGGPAAGSGPHQGRSPFPDQPQTPPPNKGAFRARPTREEEVLREFEQRRRQEEARKANGESSPSSNARPTDNDTSSMAAPQGADKRYTTDDRGFVTSDKGGPVRFADQKQAAKWIINQGHKLSPDQIFEIENHPSGKGFTVHERGRSEGPTPDDAGGSAGQSSNEAPRGAGATRGQSEPGPSSPHDSDTFRTNPSKVAAEHDADIGAIYRSAEASFRHKFYSNPIGDPEIWKELGRILKSTAGWVGREADAWSHNLNHMMHAFRLSRGSPADAMKSFYDRVRVFTDTNDGVLRTLAARHNSPTIRKIADMLYAKPGGRDGAVGETYHEAVEKNYSLWMNRMSELLRPFAKMDPDQLADTLTQIGRLVTNPGAIKKGSASHDAAAGIGQILKEALDYMRAAGVEVGEIKRGYLPRIENTDKVLADPAGFKAAAKRAFMADGVSAKDAELAADDWFKRLLLGDLGVKSDGNDFLNISSSTGQPNFTRGRVLSKRADEILGDYYLRNPADIVPRYLMRAVKRAEWSRRFGGKLEKWNEMKDAIDKEGGSQAIPEVVQAIRSATGNFGASTGGSRAALGFLRTWAVFRFLPRALYSSLAEPATIGIRTGNALDMLRGYGNSIHQWVPALRKLGDGQRLRDFAEDLGFIGDAVDQLVMMQRMHGVSEGKVASLLQSKFFRMTGLQQFTDANRVAAMNIGGRFMYRLSKDILDKTSHETMAKSLLAELGVPDNKVADFAKWANDRWESGAGKGPNVSDVLEGGEHGVSYRTALQRFIDQTVMHPTGSTRPRYANHPTGSIFYNLMSFTYAFQKNVLNRALSMGKEALKPNSDLNIGERLSYLAPLGMLPVLVAINYGVGEARDALLTDPARAGQQPKTGWEKFMTAVSRSGVDGILDYPLNLWFSARYQRDPATALAGPVWGALSEFLGAGIALGSKDNSANTNTAERKAWRAVYDNVIQPAILGAATALAPLTGAGMAVGYGAIAGGSHPGAREAFVGTIAGPPVPPRGGGGRAGRSGRSTGR